MVRVLKNCSRAAPRVSTQCRQTDTLSEYGRPTYLSGALAGSGRSAAAAFGCAAGCCVPGTRARSGSRLRWSRITVKPYTAPSSSSPTPSSFTATGMRRTPGALLGEREYGVPLVGWREPVTSRPRVRVGKGVGTGRPCLRALAARSFCMRRSARDAREPGRRPAMTVTPLLAECLSAADDLHQLRGDRSLARSVVDQRVFADHFRRLFGGRFHRGHA